jgi:hypothetical protein
MIPPWRRHFAAGHVLLSRWPLWWCAVARGRRRIRRSYTPIGTAPARGREVHRFQSAAQQLGQHRPGNAGIGQAPSSTQRGGNLGAWLNRRG